MGLIHTEEKSEASCSVNEAFVLPVFFVFALWHQSTYFVIRWVQHISEELWEYAFGTRIVITINTTDKQMSVANTRAGTG